jgi:hypothetical protein
MRMELRFRTRLTVLLLALFALVQLATFCAFYYATRHSAVAQAQTRLESGAGVFSSLMHARGIQLLDAVQVLTGDFGFKQAVATGDKPTIHTVLYNQGHRIAADLEVLSDTDGKVVASLDGTGLPVQISGWPELLQQARQTGQSSSVSMIGGKPYQLVIVPVNAPTRIAWLGMGFALNQKLALDLKKLSRLEVTFLARQPDRPVWLSSTLAGMDAGQASPLLDLGAASAGTDAPTISRVGEDDYFTQWQPLQNDGGAHVGAVLQFSRAQALHTYAALEHQLILIAVFSLLA